MARAHAASGWRDGASLLALNLVKLTFSWSLTSGKGWRKAIDVREGAVIAIRWKAPSVANAGMSALQRNLLASNLEWTDGRMQLKTEVNYIKTNKRPKIQPENNTLCEWLPAGPARVN